MLTRGAVLREVPGAYEVVDLEVDDPRQGEIRVRMVASGLCHSDDHHATGDMKVGKLPFAGLVYIALRKGTGTRCSAVGVGRRGSRGRSFIG